MELDVYEKILLSVIQDNDNGEGVGAPTIDRKFYLQLSDKLELDNIYQIQWVSILNILIDKGLVEKTMSNASKVTHEGVKVLNA